SNSGGGTSSANSRQSAATASKSSGPARRTFMGHDPLAHERVEGCGEPGGSPRFLKGGGRTWFAQDRNSLARIPVAEMRGETWFHPQTRAGGERCHETTTLTLRMTTVCVGCPDASPSFPIRSTTFIP